MRYIIQPQYLYQFTLKSMHEYFFHRLAVYQQVANFEEAVFPNIMEVDYLIEFLNEAKESQNKTFFYNRIA